MDHHHFLFQRCIIGVKEIVVMLELGLHTTQFTTDQHILDQQRLSLVLIVNANVVPVSRICHTSLHTILFTMLQHHHHPTTCSALLHLILTMFRHIKLLTTCNINVRERHIHAHLVERFHNNVAFQLVLMENITTM